MTEVSFFQQYSQKENHATNNTALLLRHIYAASPQRFNSLLNSLLDDERSLSPQFVLQKKLKHSVPDAVISQPAFGLVIEAKVGGGIDLDQINRHAVGMIADNMTDGYTLMCLTREKLTTQQQAAVNNISKKQNVRIVAVTFSDIAVAALSVTPEYDEASRNVVADYESFLRRSNLFTVGDEIFVVPTGVSYHQNAQFGMYFEPVERSSRERCRFLGLYRSKQVRQIGEIRDVVETDGNGGVTVSRGSAPSGSVFADIYAACTFYPDIKHGALRFYFVDAFHQTSIRKSTPGGIWGARTIALSTLREGLDGQSPQEVAEALNGTSFE